MTDEDLVHKKLAFIETCVADLQRSARPDAFASDLKERRFAEHTLQIAIQAMQDVASHLVSADRLGEPRNNSELMDLLSRHGWLSPDRAAVCRAMIGFRNVLVHGYTDVDLAVLRDVVERRLGDLQAFAVEVRRRLQG